MICPTASPAWSPVTLSLLLTARPTPGSLLSLGRTTYTSASDTLYLPLPLPGKFLAHITVWFTPSLLSSLFSFFKYHVSEAFCGLNIWTLTSYPLTHFVFLRGIYYLLSFHIICLWFFCCLLPLECKLHKDDIFAHFAFFLFTDGLAYNQYLLYTCRTNELIIYYANVQKSPLYIVMDEHLRYISKRKT